MLQNSAEELGTAEHDGLARRALDVLEANWRGASTVPSPALYPHQWSWDSACIAIGYSHLNHDRAEQELRSLFAGQWRNGLLPHIVFADGQDYFPGPEFWRTDVSPDAPELRRTSGIVQPPVHATSVLQVYLTDDDADRAAAFLAEMLPTNRNTGLPCLRLLVGGLKSDKSVPKGMTRIFFALTPCSSSVSRTKPLGTTITSARLCSSFSSATRLGSFLGIESTHSG